MGGEKFSGRKSLGRLWKVIKNFELRIMSGDDLVNQNIYYRTMYNASVRCLALWKIDFDQVVYQAEYLEHSTTEPIENIEVY